MNNSLNTAKNTKNDEFFTSYNDIANELSYYTEYLKGKIVYCNCDNIDTSNFVKYLKDNFDAIGLVGLISSSYRDGTYSIFSKHGEERENNGDGDFRSEYSLRLLKLCNVVITNPPFSLFREFIDMLFENKKDFIVIGNKNSFTYEEVFSRIKNNKIHLGYTIPSNFTDINGVETNKLNGLCRWFTTFPIHKEKKLELTNNYNGNEYLYPKYDNYDAINVDKVKDIPKDYYGEIGVPITYIDKHDEELFEIIGSFNNSKFEEKEEKNYVLSKSVIVQEKKGENEFKTKLWNGPVINGKPTYKRIIIKRIKEKAIE